MLSAAYTHDSLGRITQKTETVAGITTTDQYAYDAAGRLAEVKRNGITAATYGYDANGNRTQMHVQRGPRATGSTIEFAR